MSALAPFANEPVLELRRSAVRAQLDDALAALDARLPLSVPVLVGTDAVRASDRELLSTDPGDPERVVAVATRAERPRSRRGRSTARRGLGAWRARAPGARRGADRARPRGCASGAWSSPRSRSASAPSRGPRRTRTCARRSTSSSTTRAARSSSSAAAQLLQVPGERNEMRYVPRGVVAVISPWNFPLGDPVRMTSAALATGNAVVLKPAEQSPAARWRSSRRCAPAACHRRRIALLPGEGETGAALVAPPRRAHDRVHRLAAGRPEIVAAAAEVAPGQRHFKRVVAELGGKNCVIVDADADLDEAVPRSSPRRSPTRGRNARPPRGCWSTRRSPTS